MKPFFLSAKLVSINTFACIILFSSSLFGQEIGISFDGVGKVTNKKAYWVLPVSGVNTFGNAMILPGLQIEGRVGYQMLFEEYRGWEISIYLLYKVLPPLYIIGGVNYHANDGWDSNSSEVVSKGITMPGIGAGVDVASFFSIELLYHMLLKPEHWNSSLVFNGNYYRSWTDLHGVIKSNLKFRLQL